MVAWSLRPNLFIHLSRLALLNKKIIIMKARGNHRATKVRAPQPGREHISVAEASSLNPCGRLNHRPSSSGMKLWKKLFFAYLLGIQRRRLWTKEDACEGGKGAFEFILHNEGEKFMIIFLSFVVRFFTSSRVRGAEETSKQSGRSSGDKSFDC